MVITMPIRMLHTAHFLGIIHKDGGRMLHRNKTPVLLNLKAWRKFCLHRGLYQNFSEYSPTRRLARPTFIQHVFLMVSHVPTAVGQEMHSALKDGQICYDAGAVGETLG
jgi:hypothetical protein